MYPKNKFYIILLSLFMLSAASAQTKGSGIGLCFGEPSAIDFKTWISEQTALDFTIGSSVATEYYRLSISADYLWHKFDALTNRSNLPVYFGVGLNAASRSDGPMRYGVRGVVGILWHTRNFPADFYVQTSPAVHVTPETAFWFNASAGFRYFFTKER